MKYLLGHIQEFFSSLSSPRYVFALGILGALLVPLNTYALFEAGSSVSEAKLISSVEGVGDQKVVWVGLDIHLKPGWKTYWRTPGASGYGLKIDWSESKNLKSTELYWPTPTKFESFKLLSNGYKEEVIFPILLTVKKQHTPLILKAKLDYLACDVGNCIPQSKTINFTIPNNPNIPSPHLKEVTAAIKHLPEKNSPFLAIRTAEFIKNENEIPRLRLTVVHKLPLVSPEIFIEGKQKLFFDKILPLKTLYSTDGEISTIDIPLYKTAHKTLDQVENLVGKPVTVTLRSADTTIEKTVSVIAPIVSLEQVILTLGIAFLGGFILNFMPCVLPVILLKIFSLTKYAGRKTTLVRKALFLSVLGIISSFMILALIPIVFSLLGKSFGWGMQYQEPMFLIFMMLILVLFTANFLGFYEIALPEFLMSRGYKYSDRKGNLGHFLSGVFATLLATPCSAPFLGTAITFALSRGPIEILLIFFFLGIGLSFPFILIIIFPKIVTIFPKAGKWMNVFKHILGIGFLLVMLWLFYVFMHQVSIFISMLTLISLILLLLFFWLRTKFPSYRKIYTVFIAFAIFMPFIALSLENTKATKEIHQNIDMKATLQKINSSVKEGKIVFVDITADWCLTCKANEFMVIDTENVKNLLKDKNVTFIKIDWTSKDPEVYQYLQTFNHNAIPFYAIYGPKTPYGQTLPQVLTFSTIDEAIKKAK